jgi:hypothetical protein
LSQNLNNIVFTSLLKKILFIFTLLFAIGISTPVLAQRKREHKNQRRSGGGKHRGGSFAGHKTGFFSRIFSGKKMIQGGWVYKPTRPGKKQNREQHHLFSRYRTKNKRYKDTLQARLNRERAKKRVRGNATFHKRKY